MKRPKQHEIDTAAQNIFRSLIPTAWVINEHRNDYGKDYHVELGNAGVMTGEGCFVQLKRTAQVQKSRDHLAISFSLEKKYAIYYADKITQLPVFLVVVDVTTKKAWFVFLQQFLNDNPKWRQKDSATVYLPLGNDLAGSNSFQEAILKAKEWLRKRNPFAIHDALGIAKEQVEAIDPRCAVRVVADSEGEVRYEIRPKEPIPMTMTIKGDKDQIGPKLAGFAKGELVTFGPGECKIEGSDHFKDFHKKGGAIQIASKQPATLVFKLLDAAKNVVATLSNIGGEFQAGVSEAVFSGSLPNSPFAITFGPFRPTTSELCLKMNETLWRGQRLSALAYFTQLHTFFTESKAATGFDAHWYKDGNPILGFLGDMLPKEMLNEFASFFDFFDKARKVCKHFKIDPPWTDALLENEFYDDVDQAYGLFCEPEWKRQVGVGLTITAKLGPDGTSKLLTHKPTDYYIIEEAVFEILGHKIPIGKLTKEFTQMTAEIVGGMGSPGSDLILRSTPDTMRIDRLGEPPDFKPTEPQAAPSSGG